ncbi:hypothetical protein PLESTB_000809500 [Pleodorina starrii]|uniref:Mediator of RNA polymerase II transcription subunit 7 n=1 Tax=Pleodorina starrii TaxID=330485 RepID=A0A9W6BKK1_9CHLO|nr:hypothetical protein PLESTM_000915200 [Pleodorina starrii]GLC53966.1 hypothetical protein PLESTB_000809500 [Pleodorina starrii]GLC70248.1 hypothetical protein PLESTF_000948100 [Pleodorina starrii]
MAAAANNGAAMREAYPPPPSLFNLYRPDDGVSPLPPPPPPIPTPADVAALRERKIELKVLGNPLKLSEDLVPPLTTQALYRRQPDGTIDFKGELRRLSGELMFMFLELLKTLAEKPAGYAQQLTTVNVLLSNLVQLANLMRPHQARATLEATLALQVGSLRSGIARVRGQVAAADEVLAGMARALQQVEGDTAESVARPSGGGPGGGGGGGGGGAQGAQGAVVGSGAGMETAAAGAEMGVAAAEGMAGSTAVTAMDVEG